MSNFDFTLKSLSKKDAAVQPEQLRLSKTGIKGNLLAYTGKQGEHVVSIIPSMNVSGYGATEQEALDSLLENVDTFFRDLFTLSEVQRRKEFINMGWEVSKYLEKKFSQSFIDENGVLQNFDFPDQVTKSMLQAA